MPDLNILSLLIILPVVGVIFVLAIRGSDEIAVRNMRQIALATTVITFAVSLLLWVNFDYETSSFQFVEKYDWAGGIMSYQVGVDGISMLFIILSTFQIGRAHV